MTTVAEKIAVFPTVEDARLNCPSRVQHTPCPTGYFELACWAEKKLKTHRQVRCGGCGRYMIWVPRKTKSK